MCFFCTFVSWCSMWKRVHWMICVRRWRGHSFSIRKSIVPCNRSITFCVCSVAALWISFTWASRLPHTKAPAINKTVNPTRSDVLSAVTSPYPTVVSVIVVTYTATTYASTLPEAVLGSA